MAVMLRREEFVFRRKRTLDLADVECATGGSRREVRFRWNIGEGHHSLPLCERGQRPFWDSQSPQAGQCQTSLQNFTTCWLHGHIRLLLCACALIGDFGPSCAE